MIDTAASPGITDEKLLETARRAAAACLALNPMGNYFPSEGAVDKVLKTVPTCTTAQEAETAHQLFHSGLPPKIKGAASAMESGVGPNLKTRLIKSMER